MNSLSIKSFSHRERCQNFDRITSGEIFDLAVIGGGIAGAGVARDAASRGMSVVLMDSHDFAFGTSSRSSKLIHGGIRYLEKLEFHLVFEALRERHLLFEIAPHLVHPLRFMIPIYKNSRVGMFKMGLGMWLYDILALFEVPQMHERLSAQVSLQRHPTLDPQGLCGSYVYSDAYMDDDRLVIETLRSAHEFGACCINYMSVGKATTEVMTEKERAARRCIVRLECRDELDRKKLYEVRAHHVVSTVGPWTDGLAPHLVDSWRSRLRPSKGIHITVSRARLPMQEAVVLAAQDSSRIIFMIPRHEMILIGTTDTDYQGDPAEVVAHAKEIFYLLKIVNSYFPTAKLTEKDIISSYAGVRPLVDDGASTESQASREHAIIEGSQNITFLIGGKYTTYRRMAEQTMEVVLKLWSPEDQVQFARSQTKRPINSKVTLDKLRESLWQVEERAKEWAVDSQEVEKLVHRHGGEAYELLGRWLESWRDRVRGQGRDRTKELEALGLPSLTLPLPLSSPSPPSLSPLPLFIFIEARHALENTMCLHLKDFYFRRMPLFLSEKDHGLSYLEALADIFADALDWTLEQRQNQMDDVKLAIAKELHWQRSTATYSPL